MYVMKECQMFLSKSLLSISENKGIKSEEILDHTDLIFDLDKYHAKFARPCRTLIRISGSRLEMSAI
jgi:hypothetical protein